MAALDKTIKDYNQECYLQRQALMGGHQVTAGHSPRLVTPTMASKPTYMLKRSPDNDDDSSGGESYPRDYFFTNDHHRRPSEIKRREIDAGIDDDYSLGFPSEIMNDEEEDDDIDDYTFQTMMTQAASTYKRGGSPIVLARDRNREPLLYRTGSGRNLMDI
jgi:hypothetical protein